MQRKMSSDFMVSMGTLLLLYIQSHNNTLQKILHVPFSMQSTVL